MASHRRSPQPGFARTTRVTVLSAAAAATAAATAAAAGLTSAAAASAATADPAAGTSDVAARVSGLYRQAEQAIERYNAAQERADRLRHDLDDLQDQAARGQERVNRMRDDLGALAGAQYRSGGVDPSLALMLSSDPDSYLGRAEALDRAAGRQAGRLKELRDAQRSLHQKRTEGEAKLADLEQARVALHERKLAVQGKLAAARRLLNSLPAAQRAAFVPGQGPARASRGARPLGDPSPGLGASSARAALAVAAARALLGSPYAWGHSGPSAFDCSGLMLYSYRQAGVSLPRTSQEQMHAGRRVPLDQVRPGDLVVYRGDASHVGMYVGGGRIVHAPYPGARVRYDPVDVMPIAAVTRP